MSKDEQQHKMECHARWIYTTWKARRGVICLAGAHKGKKRGLAFQESYGEPIQDVWKRLGLIQ